MFRRFKLMNLDTGNGSGGAPAPVVATPAPAPDAAAIARAVEASLAPKFKAVEDRLAAVESRPAPATKATNNFGDPRQGSGVQVVGDASVGKGINLARLVKAQLISKLTGHSLDQVLDAQGYQYVKQANARSLENAAKLRALGSDTYAGGGALVPPEFSTEIIELLRVQTMVRKMGARVVPMGATLDFPEQTGAASASYVGENAAIVPTQQTVGGKRLSEKKLAALTALSNDLIRNAAISAEEFVRDDLVQVMAIKEDNQAIFGTGSVFSPKGIEALVDATYLYAATAVDVKNPTLAEVRKELAKAKKLLKVAKIPMVRCGWLMDPRTEQILSQITDGNGNAVYAAALEQGKLAGFPVMVSPQIPENLGATTDEGRLIFGDFAQFIIGESMGMEVEVFPNAAYDNGSGTVISGISLDQSVVRAIQKHDFMLRYPKAFVDVKVRWGAP